MGNLLGFVFRNGLGALYFDDESEGLLFGCLLDHDCSRSLFVVVVVATRWLGVGKGAEQPTDAKMTMDGGGRM